MSKAIPYLAACVGFAGLAYLFVGRTAFLFLGALCLILISAVAARRRLRPRPADSSGRAAKAIAAHTHVDRCIPVVLLPTVIGFATISRTVSLAAVIVLALFALYEASRTAGFRIDLPLGFWALLVVCVMAWMRHSATGTEIDFICVLIVLTVMRSTRGAKSVTIAAVDSAGLFSLASVLLHFAGYSGSGEDYRLSGLGNTFSMFFSQRVALPLGRSFVTPAVIAAVYLACIAGRTLVTTSRDRGRGRPRIVGRGVLIVMALASFYALLAADYRAPLLLALLIGILGLGWPRTVSRLALPFSVAGVTFSLWYAHASSFVTSLFHAIARTSNLFSRESGSDILSSREEFWNAVTGFYSSQSFAHKLFGFGADGSYYSGASRTYGGLFQGFLAGDLDRATPHSSASEYLLDVGIVGIVLLCFAVGYTIFRFAKGVRGGEPVALAGLCALLMFAMTSATEVTLIPAVKPEPTLWIFLAFLAGGISTKRITIAERQDPEPRGHRTVTSRRLRVLTRVGADEEPPLLVSENAQG